jgi:hypothetical protein
VAVPKRKSPVDRKFVTALSRGLEVLRCFGPRDRWLANQEIARRTGLAKPTVSRLAYTLTRLGHLRYSDTENKYALGRWTSGGRPGPSCRSSPSTPRRRCTWP